MTSKEGMQSKISIKENGVLSFTSKDNGNTFFKLFFKLSRFTAAEISTSKKKKLLESIISIFEINVRVLSYTM